MKRASRFTFIDLLVRKHDRVVAFSSEARRVDDDTHAIVLRKILISTFRRRSQHDDSRHIGHWPRRDDEIPASAEAITPMPMPREMLRASSPLSRPQMALLCYAISARESLLAAYT